MGRSKPSLRSKAVNFMTDFTTIINPIADRSSPVEKSKERASKDPSVETDDGPDTSSLGKFFSNLFWSSEPASQPKEELDSNNGELDVSSSESTKKVGGKKENSSSSSSSSSSLSSPDVKGKVTRKSMFTRGKKTLGRAMHKAVRIGGFNYNKSEPRIGSTRRNATAYAEHELMPMNRSKKSAPRPVLPDISEPSMLLDKTMQRTLYDALPLRAQGRNWVLLYSTCNNGTSLATLYRRSLICPGYYLLVVGDQKGAVFGGLVEAPLKPTNMKYQGSNSTFVFTSLPGSPSEEPDLPSSPSQGPDLPCSPSKEADLPSRSAIFNATGANRYFTLCSNDFLALGGGGHFALYLDGELLTGSSFTSHTFDNPCLAYTQEFDIKEVELWGFAHASKYNEILELCQMDNPGLARWSSKRHLIRKDSARQLSNLGNR